MRTALIVAGLLVSLVAQPQEIYRWVDKDGVVHYADQPGAPNAERIDMPGLREPPAAGAEPPTVYDAEPAQQPEPSVGPTYQSLRITSPAVDEVFYGGDVTVTVQLELDRDLRPGDQALVFVDGERMPEFPGLSTTLSGLPRGSHFLRAVVVDEGGSVVITSPQISFHLRQASIATPPTGPAVRPPPPRPRPTPLPGR